MESILRGLATYLFVWLIFRIAGKRSLAQITTFDAVLLLIISETTQAALTDNDNSFTNSVLLILTILGLDVCLSCVKQRFPRIERVMDGAPLLLFDRGKLNEAAMHNERVDEQDVLHAARERQGMPNLARVRYAVLEPTGQISIIPERAEAT
jgi:uncharacterized membrane protein YcaP (DUF421 family)